MKHCSYFHPHLIDFYRSIFVFITFNFIFTRFLLTFDDSHIRRFMSTFHFITNKIQSNLWICLQPTYVMEAYLPVFISHKYDNNLKIWLFFLLFFFLKSIEKPSGTLYFIDCCSLSFKNILHKFNSKTKNSQSFSFLAQWKLILS